MSQPLRASRWQLAFSRLGGWPALLVATLLYLPTLAHWWNSDDAWYLIDKPWSSVPTMFNPLDPSRTFYRPLSGLTFFLNYQLFGANPAAWHAVNLLWYLGCVAACYLLAKKLAGPGVASVTAILFAAHPQHPGAVSWVAALPDVQLTTFALLAACAMLTYRAPHPDPLPRGEIAAPHPDPLPRGEREEYGRLRYYLLAVGCVVLALCSKEPAVALPAVLIVGDALLHGRQLRRRGWTLLEWAGLGLPLIAYALLRSLGGAKLGYGFNPDLFAPANFAGNFSLNLLLSFGLTFDAPNLWLTLAGGLTLAALVVAAVRDRLAAYALGWLLLSLLPVTLTVAAAAANSRNTMLASVGGCLLLALALRWLYQRWAAVGLTTTVGLLLLFTVGTVGYNQEWRAASELGRNLHRSYLALRVVYPPDAIAYFRDVPHSVGRAGSVSGLALALRVDAASHPRRMIELDKPDPDRYCKATPAYYFAVDSAANITQLPDCASWLNWQPKLTRSGNDAKL